MHGANVESKTRARDLEALARVVARLGARYDGRLDQVDTYFRVPHGRLKMREISHRAPDGRVATSCELIRYERRDEGGPRVSRYERTEVDDVESCKARLVTDHGLRGCVRKRRELWMLEATRVHLDRVEDLGDFVELETVCAGEPEAADRLEHDRLAAALGLDLHATVEGSYIDLREQLAKVPRQNRVTPFSELIADSSRGLVYGNRGCLHDESGRIRRRYNGKRWIACRLEFRG
ncbi:MAG: class IV adenylate cyclase, partial [Actinobacteria bacterium]|nr:class IV adenylate cyclase [Actinomycetota bacterium]